MPDFDNDFPPLNAGMTTPSGKESKEADEEWELVSTEDEHTENDEQEEKPVVVHGNPKTLRHCASSPDLRCFAKIYEEDDQEQEEKAQDTFDMVSNVGSVWSTSSGLSFRDAFLASPIREDQQVEDAEPSSGPHTAPRPYRKPKIVVKSPSLMRRCSKSSPNLLGLIQEDEEVLGDTDATEYYSRKSKGAQGRSNGLKLRPDEAKRKAFSVNKRNLQRQNSAK